MLWNGLISRDINSQIIPTIPLYTPWNIRRPIVFCCFQECGMGELGRYGLTSARQTAWLNEVKWGLNEVKWVKLNAFFEE